MKIEEVSQYVSKEEQGKGNKRSGTEGKREANVENKGNRRETDDGR